MTDRDDLERLLEDQLGELADQVVARVVAELETRDGRAQACVSRGPDPSAPLVDVAAVARYLGVRDAWVRQHATQLRARRLGSHGRALMRFDLVEVDKLLLRDGARG